MTRPIEDLGAQLPAPTSSGIPIGDSLRRAPTPEASKPPGVERQSYDGPWGLDPSRFESLHHLEQNPPDDPGWLVKRLLPHRTYGVIGAEAKVGKTWVGLDLAMSVAYGVPFLNSPMFEVPEPHRVVYFMGEGARDEAYRRLPAIRAAKRLTVEDTTPTPERGLAVEYRSANGMSDEGVTDFRRVVEQARPALVLLDPLYLAARGANAASLFEGPTEALYALNEACMDMGSAFFVIHHFNQTGQGTGARRLAGAGAEEWARVLITMTAPKDARTVRPVSPGGSAVRVDVEVAGGVAPLEFSFDRHVRPGGDPFDFSTALKPYRYEVEEVESRTKAHEPPGQPATAKQVVELVLDELAAADPAQWHSVARVLEAAAAIQKPDGTSYAPGSLRNALGNLGHSVEVRKVGTVNEYRAKRGQSGRAEG